MRMLVQSLASVGEGSRITMSYGVGRRHSSDPALLWLWCRPAATALIRPLAWEPPYAVGAAQEIAKKKKERKEEKIVFYHGTFHFHVFFFY